jgi:hypothetical protein
MIKTTTNHRLLLMAAIMLAGVFTASSAHALAGKFDGTISEKLQVTDCGQDTDVITASTILNSNKTWKTSTDEGTFNGKYRLKRLDSGARKLFLSFNSKSKKLFMKNMRIWASDICGIAVKNLKNFKYSIKLKLNKKRTALSGEIKGTATGSTSEGSGKGTYTASVKMRKR